MSLKQTVPHNLCSSSDGMGIEAESPRKGIAVCFCFGATDLMYGFCQCDVLYCRVEWCAVVQLSSDLRFSDPPNKYMRSNFSAELPSGVGVGLGRRAVNGRTVSRTRRHTEKYCKKL